MGYDLNDTYRLYKWKVEGFRSSDYRLKSFAEKWALLAREIERQYTALPEELCIIWALEFDGEGDYTQLRKDLDGGCFVVSDSNHPYSPHPLAERNLNVKFRVIHDFYGHYLPDNDFSWEGECAAYDAHKRMFSPSVWGILKAEILGQAAWTLVTGEFISPQPAVEMEV